MQRIAENVFIGTQIRPEDIPALQAEGIAQIVCHRPDGESIDQPDFAEIAAAAGEMRTVHVPVAGAFPPEAVAATAQALAAGVPTLMFCKSGMRSCALWALAEVQNGRDAAEVMRAAAAIGYDLSPLLGLLQAQG